MKFQNLKRPEYKRMYAVIKQNLAPYFSRAILVVLVLEFLKIFITSFSSIPAFNLLLNENPSAAEIFGNSALSIVIFFIVRMVCEILSFGAIMYFTNVIVTRNAKFQDIFTGFKSYKKNPYLLSLIFIAASLVALILVFAAMFIFRDFFNFDFAQNSQSNLDFTSENLQKIILPYMPKIFILTAVFFVFYFAVKVFFIFTPNVMRDFKLNFSASVKRNFLLIHKNYFHFLGFELYINLKNIAIYAVCYALELFIPQSVMQKVSFIPFLLNFAIFFEQYTILAKFYSGIPVYYYSILSVNNLIRSHNLKFSSQSQEEIPADSVSTENDKNDFEEDSGEEKNLPSNPD